LPAETEKTYRTRAEIEAIISVFAPPDWIRLERVAKAFGFGTGLAPGDLDLLQEALLRTLRGTRNCPSNVDVMKHLIDTMSSIADGERDKAWNEIPYLPIAHGDESDAENPASTSWSAEEQLIFDTGREEIRDLFAHDATALEMVEGIMAGFDTNELKELTGLDGAAYDSKRTLVRRRLLKWRNDGRS
jgi:hypothetical protein